MGLEAKGSPKTYSVNLTQAEVALYAKEFKSFDTNNDGHIKAAELRVALKNMGEEVTDEQLHDLIESIDLNRNGAIELDEYLQLMSALKTGELANTPIATIYQQAFEEEIRR